MLSHLLDIAPLFGPSTVHTSTTHRVAHTFLQVKCRFYAIVALPQVGGLHRRYERRAA